MRGFWEGCVHTLRKHPVKQAVRDVFLPFSVAGVELLDRSPRGRPTPASPSLLLLCTTYGRHRFVSSHLCIHKHLPHTGLCVHSRNVSWKGLSLWSVVKVDVPHQLGMTYLSTSHLAVHIRVRPVNACSHTWYCLRSFSSHSHSGLWF